jgi:hypothetical protein
MTNRIGPKEVMTFTALLAKSEKLRLNDKEGWRKLTSWAGSPDLLSDCYVRAIPDGTTKFIHRFEIRKGNDDYCYVSGRVIGGQCYSVYEPRFLNSKYSKRVQRYLPFDLPEKLRMHDYCRMRLFNVDGTIASDIRRGWSTYGRGRTATPMQKICIRDSDGQVVSENTPGLGDLACYIQDPVQVLMGDLPDTCQPREWFDSMVGTHWDSSRVRLLAIKVYKEALRIVSENPHMKIALYPMLNRPVNSKSHPSRLCITNSNAHVLERDALLEPIMYYLPSLCLYYTEDKRYFRQVKCIYATIPPHGCRLLELDQEKVPPRDRQVRHGIKTFGENLKEQLANGCVLERVAYTFGTTTKLDGVKVDWGAHPDLIRTWEYNSEANSKTAKAVKPEDAFNCIEERALMSSLPLC